MTLRLVAAGMSMLSTPAPALYRKTEQNNEETCVDKVLYTFMYLPTTLTRLLLAESTSADIFVSERTIKAS